MAIIWVIVGSLLASGTVTPNSDYADILSARAALSGELKGDDRLHVRRARPLSGVIDTPQLSE